MEAHPRAVLRRELGLKAAVNCPPVEVKKYLRSLQCNEADKIQVGENEDNFVEEIPLYDVKFCPRQYHPHFFAASDELGFLSIINTREGEGDSEKVILKHQCHKNALFSMDWSPFKDGMIATCSGDNTVKIWDIQKNFQDNTTFRAHERTVKAVKFHPTSQDCLCSGGRDGNIIFWDARIGGSAAASNTVRKAHGSKRSKDSEAVSVTDILFYDDNTVISSGATDGCIKFWDLRKTYSGLKKMIPVSTIEWPKDVHNGTGYVSMCLDQQNNLYGCTLHEIFKFNLSTTVGTPEPATFLVPYKLNYYVKVNVSQDGRFLISGSSTSESYIWDTFDPSPDAFVYLNCDSQSSCIAVFSPEDTFKVVTGGDDGRIQIWRPNLVKLAAEDNDLSDHEMTKGIDRAHHKSLQDVPDDAFVRPLNPQQLETNSRASKLAKMSLMFKSKDLNPTNGLFLSNLLSNNYRDHVNYHPNGEQTATTTTNFDLGSLLKDLPNFAIDGTHPSIPRTPTNNNKYSNGVQKSTRKPCWLGELKLTLNPPSPTSASPTNTPTTTPNVTTPSRRGNGVGGGKRAYSKTSQNQNQNSRPPKKIKLKLKSRTVTNVVTHNTTPKRSPKTTTTSLKAVRRNSMDATTTMMMNGNSPTSNIMKYFSAVRPIPFPLSAVTTTESSL